MIFTKIIRGFIRAKHGTAIVIENERHMVNLTAPDKVNNAMQAWLETSV